jgi:hypothetical protein
MKKLLSLSLSLLFLAGSLSSCKKNNGSAPALPPAASLTIDFSNFGSNKKSADIFTDTKGTNSSNWDFAASVVSTWKLIIATNLAVPVTAFKRVIDEDPVFVSDKTWQWSYNAVSYLGITYKARLTGQSLQKAHRGSRNLSGLKELLKLMVLADSGNFIRMHNLLLHIFRSTGPKQVMQSAQ